MSASLETRDLQVVQAVSREGGVSRAARALHLSQSAVSHHLSRLEERLGVELFERVGRGLRITPAGERLLQLGDEVLPKIEAVERSLRAPEKQTLRIATQCYTAYHWLPDIHTLLEAQHPGVGLRIVLEATADPLRALEGWELDLAIVHAPVHDRRFASQRLGEDELVLVMAPDHPLTSKRRLHPIDLHEYTLFTFEGSPDELRARARATFPEGDAPPTVRTVPLTDALVQLVRSGQGVSILSRWVVQPWLRSGELTTRPLCKAKLRRTWRAVHRRGTALDAALRSVASQLRHHGVGGSSHC